MSYSYLLCFNCYWRHVSWHIKTRFLWLSCIFYNVMTCIATILLSLMSELNCKLFMELDSWVTSDAFIAYEFNIYLCIFDSITKPNVLLYCQRIILRLIVTNYAIYVIKWANIYTVNTWKTPSPTQTHIQVWAKFESNKNNKLLIPRNN